MTNPANIDSDFYFVHQLLRARDYQDRPEFNQLCDWWKNGGTGVLALVGIGGAGKTALTDRFLRIIPGVFPEHPDLPKDDSLPTPQRLFVFSFYDAPNAGVFFAQLYAWLQGRLYNASEARPSYQQVLAAIQTAPSLMLVLDGLEKIQDDGARGGVFGRISDGALREFVQRIAEGLLPRVSLLISTRFPLEDLEYLRSPYHQKILVESISSDAGIALLRQRGVRGTDSELKELAERCGLHALTVDLVGGYIAHFGQGDPSTPLELPSADELQQVADKKRDRRLRYVAEQSARFARVAERYRQAFQKSDPAALALLERVCLFRLGVTAEILTNIFTGEGKAEISGTELAQFTLEEVEGRLNFLTEMRILEKDPDNTYAIHPAVRDGFRAGLNAELAQQGHDVARQVLEDSLGERPGGSFIPNPFQLDLFEEIIYHTIEAGHIDEACELIQREQIQLIGILGYYEQGKRILSGLTRGKNQYEFVKPETVKIEDWFDLFVFFSSCHSGLGDIKTALLMCQYISTIIKNDLKKNQLLDDDNILFSYLLKMENLLLQNRIKDALISHQELEEEILERELEKCIIPELEEVLGDARQAVILCYRGVCRFFQGFTKMTILDFNRILYYIRNNNDNNNDEILVTFTIFRGDLFVYFLLRRGFFEEILYICNAVIELSENQYNEDYKPYENQKKLNVILAEICIARKELKQAAEYLHLLHDWALERGAKEFLCLTALAHARLELAKSNQSLENCQIDEQRNYLQQALRYIDEGLHIARNCGYGIYHIDLLIVQAQTHLLLGLPQEAERDTMTALYGLAKPVGEESIYTAQVLDESSLPEERGIFPPEDSGLPELLAATHSASGYAWGQGDAHHLLAEAFLLQAAQILQAAEFVPARLNRMSEEVQRLIERARQELQTSLEIRQRIQDPKAAETEQVIQDLNGGILTNYPLYKVELPQETEAKQSVRNASTQPNDIFIAYAYQDNENSEPEQNWLNRLLINLKSLGLENKISVWSDRQMRTNNQWQQEVQSCLNRAKVALLLVSPTFLKSEYIRNGEFPVLLKNAAQQGLTILPLMLYPSSLQEVLFRYPDPVRGSERFSLADLRANNAPLEILSELSQIKQNRVLLSVARRLMQSVESAERVDVTQVESPITDNSQDETVPTKVFISYSWDSDEHKDKVLGLAQALRDDGLDCIIDQFVTAPDNWDRWMLDQVDESKFVLIVCSERYYRRYRNQEEANRGLGVTWESTLIMGQLYDSQGENSKFYPLFFDSPDKKIIPDGIRTSFYNLSEYNLVNLDMDENRLTKKGGYQELYRLLTNQPSVIPRKVGSLKKLETVNREI